MSKIHHWEAEEVRKGLADRTIVLIDVREPQEFAAERIHGALLFPLSTFDAYALPEAHKRKIVFQCGSGKRSATAVAQCAAAGLAHNAHLSGGIAAWKQAGFATVAIDPGTGQVQDRR
ncbi:MAG: rhodanese-like domain-containing protein [Alphaproteobacteria bacterium]|nr:rhodanese-like domain-containing protein [Alphaproteobacteria bacterium]